MSRIAGKLAEMRRRNGTWATVGWLGRRLTRPVLGTDVMHVVWLDVASFREPLKVEPGFTFRFLEADEVRDFATDAAHDLPAEMAERVARGHDLCFAALDGDRLAAYGWYAPDCIEAEHNMGVAMSYPPDVAYMYKGFTHPDYRGRRLHSLVMGLALEALAQRGIRRLVSTVEWTNLASLKSCFRLGYEDLGKIVTFPWGSQRYPAEAQRRGVSFGPRADLGSRTASNERLEPLRGPHARTRERSLVDAG